MTRHKSTFHRDTPRVVGGCAVQQDLSGGQGHCWRTPTELPVTIEEEIAAEILDGGKDECEDYVASNGQHYRWS